MTKPKLSFATVVIGTIGKHSAYRVSWVTKKKDAAKHVNPDAAFKKVKGELGAELDKLRDLLEAAKKFLKAYPGLDADGKKRVTAQIDKCTQLMRAYEKVCQTEANKSGLSPAKKGAWDGLYSYLVNLETRIDVDTRPVLA